MSGSIGLYSASGYWNVTVVDGSSYSGLYALDGSINVVSSGSGWRGPINQCGALNITVADGSRWVGEYAPDGSLNAFLGDGTPFGCISVNDVTGGLSGSPSYLLVFSDGSTATWSDSSYCVTSS